MGKIETKISTIEFKNDTDNLSLVEKIEMVNSIRESIDKKYDIIMKLSIEFSEKVFIF